MVSTRTRPGSKEFESLTRSARTTVTFVQIARAAVFEGGRLTLEDLEPTTIWLTHAPGRRVGHMATGTFLDVWWHYDSGLALGSLKGVLGRADPDAQLLGDAVLRLRDPRISGSGLQYDAALINGSVAATVGACVLFLGPGDVTPAQPPEAPSRAPWRP